VIGVMKENTKTKSTNIFNGEPVRILVSMMETLLAEPIGEGLFTLTNSAFGVPLQIGDIVSATEIDGRLVCDELVHETDHVSIAFLAPEDKAQCKAVSSLVTEFVDQGAHAEDWNDQMAVVTMPPDKADEWIEKLESVAPDLEIGEQGEWVIEAFAERNGHFLCPLCGRTHSKEHMEEMIKQHRHNN
jgi:hypothetical protein